MAKLMNLATQHQSFPRCSLRSEPWSGCWKVTGCAQHGSSGNWDEFHPSSVLGMSSTSQIALDFWVLTHTIPYNTPNFSSICSWQASSLDVDGSSAWHLRLSLVIEMKAVHVEAAKTHAPCGMVQIDTYGYGSLESIIDKHRVLVNIWLIWLP